MAFLYSPSAGGFFHPEIHGAAVPADAVKISDKRHAELMAAQAAGDIITAGKNGRPVAVKPATSREQLELAARASLRRQARRRILAVASLERQSNDNAQLALAALQIAADGAARVDFLPAAERRAKIDELRARSNELELELAAMSLEQLRNFDAGACRWPEF